MWAVLKDICVPTLISLSKWKGNSSRAQSFLFSYCWHTNNLLREINANRLRKDDWCHRDDFIFNNFHLPILTFSLIHLLMNEKREKMDRRLKLSLKMKVSLSMRSMAEAIIMIAFIFKMSSRKRIQAQSSSLISSFSLFLFSLIVNN